MNIWLGIITCGFIIITAALIYLKHRNIKSVTRHGLLLCVASTALWFGSQSAQLWVILLCSIIVGLSLIAAFIYTYDRIFTSGKINESVGENKKPKPFGNGYWR